MTTPDDDELDAYLRGEDPVSRAYRNGARDQAPAELDETVLQAARDAVRRPRRRWHQPLAAAASVALTIGLVVAVHDRLPWPLAARDQAAASGEETARSTADNVTTDARHDTASSDSAARYAAELAPDSGSAAEQGAPEPKATEPSASDQSGSQSSAVPAPREAKNETTRSRLQALEERLKELESKRASLEPQSQDLASDQDAATRQDQKPSKGDSSQELKRLRQRAQALKQQLARRQAKAGATKEKAASDDTAGGADAAASAPSGRRVESTSQGTGDSPSGQAATASTPTEEPSAYRRSPESWLSRIRELRHHGKRDRAAEEINAFLRQYPERELPAELRDLANNGADQSSNPD